MEPSTLKSIPNWQDSKIIWGDWYLVEYKDSLFPEVIWLNLLNDWHVVFSDIFISFSCFGYTNWTCWQS